MPEPAHVQIFSYYEQLITSGHLRPGAVLPSVQADCDTWSTTSKSVERARRMLCEAGLITAGHGRRMPCVAKEVSE